MKWNTIRTKVLGVMIACLVAGLGGTVLLLQYSYARNSQSLATEAITVAQKTFGILESRETSKMVAVGETLALNPAVRDALAARDRARLLELTGPLFVQLKSEGITNWMFHSSEPDMRIFLRLHNPAKFGDTLGRFIDKEVVRTHAVVSGNELGKAGFAVRTMRPFYDAHGAISGYVEFGEEIGRFTRELKSQTGDDYGLLLNKKFVDRGFWADSNALLKRRDNWGDHPGFVVADNTSANDRIIQYQGDLAAVGTQGRVLERYNEGDSVFVRGIFPIFDTAHNTVGAIFVVRNISGVFSTMRSTQTLLIVMSVVGLVFGVLLVSTLLDRLVFRRLQRIIKVATRVVGGDYDSEIAVTSDDEIGQFECLFEQFRCVFVDLLSNVQEYHEKT